MKTFTFAAGAAVGYVLGTKAGREKYQQIVNGVHAIGRQPAVQNAQLKIRTLAGQIPAATDTVVGGTASGSSATAGATAKRNASTATPLTDSHF